MHTPSQATAADLLALSWHGAAVAGADDGRRAALARHALFDEGRSVGGLVADGILDSWRRCQRAGLQPGTTPVFQPVSRSKVAYLSGRDHVLLRAAQAPFDELQASLSHSRCKVMLTDRAGVLLRATPAGAEDSALLRAASRPGVDLGELMAGTNAPSLAAATGTACEVGTGEHYYDLLRSFRCVAAPIRNRDGHVVAVLDLTIEDRPFGFNAAWLVGAYASTIENNLRIAQTRRQVLLRLHPSPALLDSPAAGLAAIDEHGRISWLNEVAGALMGIDTHGARSSTSPTCEDALGASLAQVLDLTVARQPRALALPSGLTVWLQAEFRRDGEAADEVADEVAVETPAASETPQPHAASLAQLHRDLIDRTLADCCGNISQAARQLGVSRGLLYRRLREKPGADC